DVEGDALAQEGAIDRVSALAELGRSEPAPQLVDAAVLRTDAAVVSHHLVVDAGGRRIGRAPRAAVASGDLTAGVEHRTGSPSEGRATRAHAPARSRTPVST